MMCNHSVLQQIEELREQLNEAYKLHSVITPELVELSTRLDDLINQLYRCPECT